MGVELVGGGGRERGGVVEVEVWHGCRRLRLIDRTGCPPRRNGVSYHRGMLARVQVRALLNAVYTDRAVCAVCTGKNVLHCFYTGLWPSPLLMPSSIREGRMWGIVE